MQSLKDRRAMIVSHMNMEEEDDLNHEHLCESGPNSQNEILHLPDVCSLLKNSQVDVNSSLQKEFFSLKIRNCSLFKAVPLPHISKKMPSHLSEPTRLNLSVTVSSKDSSHLLFSPERGRLDKFYKALVSTKLVPELHIKSSVSATTKQTNEVVKERALHSVQLGYADVLHYLIINQQLDLGAVDEKNRNLIFVATIYDQPKILDYFLDMGLPIPDVNHAAENGNTPLHAAVNTGKMHLVSLLLHYPGINVNFPNPQCDGATALHLAIVYGYLGICYLLLNAAADVESPLGDLTPVQLAENFGSPGSESRHLHGIFVAGIARYLCARYAKHSYAPSCFGHHSRGHASMLMILIKKIMC
ncbi:protein FAM220A isoform X6 [Mauremys reevesii]|uniref:protein FAM220A isoform X6 n=1 Tax=Mauremys reevesii TaxID=260615 RepID=UPI00193F1306|nr:protein FAM220A isoform X6 [Mauremys reevesii]